MSALTHAASTPAPLNWSAPQPSVMNAQMSIGNALPLYLYDMIVRVCLLRWPHLALVDQYKRQVSQPPQTSSIHKAIVRLCLLLDESLKVQTKLHSS